VPEVLRTTAATADEDWHEPLEAVALRTDEEAKWCTWRLLNHRPALATSDPVETAECEDIGTEADDLDAVRRRAGWHPTEFDTFEIVRIRTNPI
jgi:hypothetical protein